MIEPTPTIEEYLRLSDWKFELSIERGRHADFYWLRSRELGAVDLFDNIDLPQHAFRVLVTDFDGGGAASVYGKRPGWQCLGEYALSEPVTAVPEMFYGAQCLQMILDGANTGAELLHALASFEEPGRLDNVSDFWNAIAAVQPFCYWSYGMAGGFTFISPGSDLIEQLLSRVSVDAIEEKYKNAAAANRASLWQSLGPESGPEMCIETRCDRLRIKLAVRCFMHQLRWGRQS